MPRLTIRLREHEAQTFELTGEQVRELAAASAYLRVGLTTDGHYELRARDQVGTIVLPTTDVLIRPKIDIPDFFFLLSYAAKIRWSTEVFPYAFTDDLFASLVWFFDAEMERARVYGLPRDYVDTQETLSTIRGRIDVGEQLRQRQLRPYPLECRFQEYTQDTDLNRVLKEAHAAALAIPGLDNRLAVRVGERYRRLFADVSAASYADGVPEVRFTRLTAHWQPAFWLASLLISFRALQDEQGRIVGRAFTVRMDRVFERFVELVVTEELARAGWEVSPQLPVSLTTGAQVIETKDLLTGVGMRPDLIIQKAGIPVAVADVKYRRTEDVGDFQQPDVYQLFAYCAALGVPRGLLIYADPHAHTTQRAALPAYTAHVDLDTIGIDLSAPWRKVLDQARGAAAALAVIAARSAL
jgi:5-methylcytosine-specific restriction enzyme subunit McrC